MKEITLGQAFWKNYLRPFKGNGIILLIVFFFSIAGFSQHPYGFLDGDVINNDSKLDWANVYTNTGLPAGSITTGIQFDAMNPDDIFTGGSTKDHLPISGWLNKFQEGSSSDKSNILQGGAILIGGRIYFFGNRFSNEGATNIGFWFFQDDVNILNGSFEGEHQIGDILVVVEITNGGAIGSLAAYEWRENEANGGTVPSSTKSLIKIVDENMPNPFLLDAVVNLSSATTPWSYQAKGEPVPNLMPPVSFFEGFINIAGLNLTNACFSSFLVETRSSFSITSILEDFLGSNFNVQPLVEIDDLTDCEDEFPQTLTAEVTGGIPPFTFEWKKDGEVIVGESTSSISVSEAGLYSVTVTGDGIGGLGDCKSEPDTATVTIYNTVDAGTDGTDRFCIGDAVNGIVNLVEIITGEEAGGSWADTDATGVDISDPTSVDLSGLGDGVYVFTYTVTPATGSTCPPDSSTATITIDDTVNAGTDGTDRFCIGDAVNGIVNLVEIITGEDTGGSWVDTDATGVDISDPTSVDLSTLGDGVYVFTYTVSPGTGSTCPPDSSTATITIDDTVNAGTDGTDRFCIGDAVNGIVNLVEIITGEEAGGSWADTDATGVDISDPTSVDLSTLGDGVYVFTYTVSPGTGSTCPPDSSTATITIDDTVNAGTDGTDRFCEGDAVNGIVNLFDIINGEDTGGSWVDTDATGVDISDPTSVDLSTLGDGVYVFTYIVSPGTGSTCPPDSSTATITIDDTVDAGTDGTDRFCEGDAVNGIVNLFDIINGEDTGGSWVDTDATGVDISDPTSVDLSTLGDGVYVFTYTVSPGTGSTCPPDSSTATITIDDTVDAGTDGTDRFCEGDAVNGIMNLFDIINGEDTGGSWVDTDATGVDISDPTSVDLSTLGDGVYVFTYTVSPGTGSTCPPDSSTVTITIDDLPPTPTPQVEPADCINTSSNPEADPVYVGSVAFTYPEDSGIGIDFYYSYKEDSESDSEYSDPVAYSGPIDLAMGDYNFRFLLEMDGCVSDPIDVKIDQLPQDPLDITLSLTQPDCATLLGGIQVSQIGLLGGDAVNIDDYLFSLFDNNADPSDPPLVGYNQIEYPVGGFTNLSPGSYRVFALGKNGCNSGVAIADLIEPQCVECETAFGKDDGGADICFQNVPGAETLIPNETRWGWTNLYSFGGGVGEDVNTLNLYQGAAHCEDGTFVGTVTLTRTGNTLSVKFEASANYYFGSIHLYVGGEPFMYKKQGKNYSFTVAPGQYNQNPSSLPSEYVTEYTINGIVLTGDYYVIAHVDACTSEYQNINEDNISSAIAGFYEPKKRFATMLPAINDGSSTKTTTTTTSLAETSEPIFSIAPVPFKDVLNIGYLFDYTSDVTIQVFDLNGRLLTTYKDTAVNSDSISTFNVDFRTKSNQIYIVRMTTDREVYSAKIISEK